MYCEACGQKIDDSSIYCEHCGSMVHNVTGGDSDSWNGGAASGDYGQSVEPPKNNGNGGFDPFAPQTYGGEGAYQGNGSAAQTQPMGTFPQNVVPGNQGTTGESPSKGGFSLQDPALYVAIAVVVVIVVVLLVLLFGQNFFKGSGDDVNANNTQSTVVENGNTQNSNSNTETIAIPSDTSKPFWGVWTYFTMNESDAKSHAVELTNKGYKSSYVECAKWTNLTSESTYAVFTGTWQSESEANTMLGVLKDAGYSSAYVKYTGSAATSNTVTLTVQAASGSTLSGIVHRDSNGYVLADSSTREYSVSELKALNLTDAELCVAWNEPFARLGYHFKNPGLRAYFLSCSWYTDEGASVSLTGAAATNNSNLRTIAEQSSTAKLWENLATS